MNKFSFMLVLLAALAVFSPASAQRTAPKKAPAKPAAKQAPKKYVLRVPPLPPKVIEVEDWKPFSSDKEKFKIDFPKPPGETTKTGDEYDVAKVTISSAQSYVNGNLYLVNVRHYPKDYLPKRMDLGEHYAAWLRRFIKDEDVISLKRLNYGDYVGYEFIYKQVPADVIVLHDFVIGDRLYQIVMFMEAEKGETLEKTIERNKTKIAKFFESFEVTEMPFDNRTSG